MNVSIASRAGMSRWFVGSSSSSRLAGMIPSSASSSRDRSPPDSVADLLEHVVAAEQEAGQVAARLARRDRDRLEERVEDGRPGIAAPRSWAR